MALHSGGTVIATIADAVQIKLPTLAEIRPKHEPVHVNEAMVRYMLQVEARGDGEMGVQGITTGIAGLDALLNGGPNRGNLVIIDTRPSMGKTALAVNIACHAASGARVLVLSMKMTLKELIDRVIAAPVVGPVLSIISRWSRSDEALVTRTRHGALARPTGRRHADPSGP